jgi:hypothetical protein
VDELPTAAEIERHRAALAPSGVLSLIPVLKALAYVIPAVAAYLLAVYYRANPGLYPTATALLWPPYRDTDTTVIKPDLDYEKRYYAEFSRSYFDRENNFSTLTDDYSEKNPELRGALRMRVTMRNPTRADPLLIGTVTLRRRFTPRPFDWLRVDDMPRLRLTQNRTRLTVSDDGNGPSLDVHYAVTSNGLTLLTGAAKMIYHGEETASLLTTTPTVLQRHVTTGRLDRPLYRATAPGEARGQELCAGRWFEVVDTVPRLSQLAAVAYHTDSRFVATYESLRRKHLRLDEPVTLPSDIVYLRRTPVLLESNPCIPEPPEPPPVPQPSPPAVAPPPPPFELVAPKDISEPQLIIATVKMDLVHDEQVTIAPEQILKPGGYLHLRIDCTNPQNGTYAIDVLVNGDVARHVDVETLRPDRFRFDRSDVSGERSRLSGTKREPRRHPPFNTSEPVENEPASDAPVRVQ